MPLAKGLLGVGAAGAGLGGLLGSEEAEAAPMLTFAKGIDAALASRQMKNKLNKDRAKGISGEKSVADYIHRNSNYENGFIDGARKWDGGLNGESYVSGINSMADELIESIDDPYLIKAVEDWRASRLDSGRHSKYGRGAMVAAPAVAAAGAANAGEAPEMGWRDWPTQGEPTTPAARGFPDWSEYEPEPSYLDRVTDPATYANALRPYVQGAGWLANTRLGQHIAGQLGEAMDSAQMPGQAVHGIGRGVYGLATGESPSQAFSAGMDVAQNDLAENGALMKQWATDRGWHKDDAAAAGFATEFLADPLTYAGMGLLGKIGKAF